MSSGEESKKMRKNIEFGITLSMIGFTFLQVEQQGLSSFSLVVPCIILLFISCVLIIPAIVKL